MDSLEDYYWRKPTEYRSFYHLKIYGYMDLTCCVVTVISNAFVVMVFTRKSINSPTNTILTHIAITESLAILSYVPRAWHEYFRVEICSIPQHRTFIWETISLNAYTAAFIFRHMGVWMGVMLAVWRYIAVIHPLKERDWCNMRNTRIWIFAGYVSIVLITIPAYLCIAVGPTVKSLDQNGCLTSNFTIGQNVTIYEFQIPAEDYPFWYTTGFLVYGFFVKILPSVVLTTISYKLIVSLVEVGEHRKKMITSQRRNSYNTRMKIRIKKQTDRTTKILLVILILFILAEVPHGIFAMITVFYGPKFFWKHYYYGMELFNSLTHISESFNFVIYYTMSYQFRNTFKALFNGESNNRIVNSQRSTSSLPGLNSNRSSSIKTISSTCA